MLYQKAVGAEQTREEKKTWLKANAKPGTIVVILDTQAGLNCYQKVEIVK